VKVKPAGGEESDKIELVLEETEGGDDGDRGFALPFL
jgi:hypothetical protein